MSEDLDALRYISKEMDVLGLGSNQVDVINVVVRYGNQEGDLGDCFEC